MNAEKMLEKMSSTKQKIARQSKDITLCKHAIAVIARHGEVSVAALKESLSNEINGAPSAQGACSPEQDLQLMAAKDALEYLEQLVSLAGK